MSLTDIADQRTPARPVEIAFAASTALPSANQNVLLIGHTASGSATGTTAYYTVKTINNSADADAGFLEAEGYFGVNSELAKMVKAAINANAGNSNFPQLKAVSLPYAQTGFGPADEALTSVARVQAEFVVSCYDGNDSTTRNKLKATTLLMSGAQRVENGQFGSIGVVFNRSVTDPSSLPLFDSQYVAGFSLRDTSTGALGFAAPTKSIGEMAAACAALIAGNAAPFNPLDDVTINNVDAPTNPADFYSVGSGLESETALNQGWTPLKVKPNGEVAFVRTITGRISADGSGLPVLTAYYDIQDFQVLYFWRKTLWTRWSQPDLKTAKASADTGKLILSEAIRLAQAFQDQNMFQAVDQLAKQFQVERSTSDRHRFDVLTPVNVIPGLHIIATKILATTLFDTLSL